VFVRRFARSHPDVLVIGLDANGAGLRDASRRVAQKPARGGLPNALFGRLALEQAPGELAGLAAALTILFPWGSLLRAVALPEPEALARLGALCGPGASVRIVFGYDPAADAVAGLSLSEDELDPRGLERRYRAAGFSVAARLLAREEIAAVPTSWAGKLAFSQRSRRFLEVTGLVDVRALDT
jgi:16S rRNA (adenine(1408)-N(1))-methyltransferase